MIKKTIYALGFFDGVHLGHQALLRAAKTLAAEADAVPGVITFADHPDALVLGTAPGLIETPEQRERRLREAGMERILVLPFDEKMLATPWQDFIRELLEHRDAAGFVCGEDFRFGQRGAGTALLLRDFCRERKLPCAVVPEQTRDGQRVSSTAIREFLAAGDMPRAAEFLGHPYRLTGIVRHGKQLGRTLGFPTANLPFPEGLARPRFGVYAGIARLPEGSFPAVTNLGLRPTVDGHSVTVESWLLDFQGDIYGRELAVDFLRFLRPEQKFPTLEAMREEILRNANEARTILKSAPKGKP